MGLIGGVLVSVLLAGFLFALVRALALHQMEQGPVDALRATLFPLLFLQGVILFGVGTAQVAGGMTAERDEGVIDYQRLIPMTPLAKITGYLFGLPIREYVMFFSTLPFTGWALWKGGVAVEHWLPVYVVLFSSTLLYHFTGLLTGTVVKSRRWAFLASIGLVFCLYTVFPRLADFGLVFFKYLTMVPVFQEQATGMMPRVAGDVVAAGQRLTPSVKFFNLDFSELVFTLFTQAGLILTFVVMLHRKWRRAEAHLLDKLWALLFFLWVQALLLGNALPMVAGGSIFPSRGLARYAGIGPTWAPAEAEALGMSVLYGVVTLLLIFILGGMITPTPENQQRGWRRALKQGKRSLFVLSDAATSFWFVVLMALAGAWGWYEFTRGVIESRWFPGSEVPRAVLYQFGAVMLVAGVGFQALLEWKGGRAVWLATVFAGVVPLMGAAVISASSDELQTLAIWVAGASPMSLPLFAPGSLLQIGGIPEEVVRAVPKVFRFWLPVMAVVSTLLVIRLAAFRRRNARRMMESDVKEDAA